MTILGIDPGTAATGYAVLELKKTTQSPYYTPTIKEVSCIKTSKDMLMHDRLRVLFDNLTSVVLEHNPTVMIVERLFFNTNVKTALAVGQARGIPLLVASHKKMNVFEYTALEAKHALTGYGRADKKAVQEAVRTYLNLPAIIKPDDANDAVAIALCYLNKDFNIEELV